MTRTRDGLPVCVAVLTLMGWAVAVAPVVAADGPTCSLPADHAGLRLPVERIPNAWQCRLAPIVTDFTTANKIGPVMTPLPLSLYRYLLDHPPVAAALVNRLELGLHKAEVSAPGRYWLTDGEGTEGQLELVLEARQGERTLRLYYLEGTHDGRFLPAVAGRAVVLLSFNAAMDERAAPATETTMVAYLQVPNRMLAGLLSLVRPFVGQVVLRQVGKAFDTAAGLAHVMREDPARVLFEAADPPAIAQDAIAVLQAELSARHNSVPDTRPTPAGTTSR